jgi:hypothetical protein
MFEMKRFLLVLPLAACAGLPVEEVSSPPISVLRALPPGVSTDDLRKQGGCFFYLSNDKLVPISESKIEGGQLVNKQVCA